MPLVKGSPEAKAWAAKMRAARENVEPQVPITPKRSTLASTEAGINIPPPESPKGVLIQQVGERQLLHELDTEDYRSEGVSQVEGFIKLHWDQKDANLDLMGRVLKLSVPEITDILKEMGYSFPAGV